MRLTLAEALKSARETRALLLGPGVLRDTGALFKSQFPSASAVIIADQHTFPVAGAAVAESLHAVGIQSLKPFIFDDPSLYAESRFVDQLETFLRTNNSIPIAVGSGTLNDITKLAAHRAGRESYLCAATAASMDGYTAYGASITHQGSKQTFNCPAPRAVIADTDIIRRAPKQMTASGYADLAAKITAGADWILAHALNVEPIDPRAWDIVQGGLRDALADPAGARAGEESAITPLVEGLMLGGFAMQWSRSSRPASGAEHQFSHLWDMEHHSHNGSAPSHGFKVGIATLAVTRLYEKLLDYDIANLSIDNAIANWPSAAQSESQTGQRFAKDDFLETALTETRVKYIAHQDLRAHLELLKQNWPEIRSRLRTQLLPSDELESHLKLVGAPTAPEEIGISSSRLRETFARAYHIRRRHTVLDLAIRAGILNPLLDKVFA